MRQRGAGSRKVDNIDFGLNFPTPGSRRSRSATPASRIPHTFRGQRSAARRSREPSLPRDRRSVSATPGQEAYEQRHTNKRRKVSIESQKEVGTASASVHRRQSSAVFPIAEDEVEAEIANEEENISAYQEASPFFMPRNDIEKENDTPEPSNTAKKRKKRKSIIPAALRKKKRPSGSFFLSSQRESSFIQTPVLSRSQVDRSAGRQPSLELGSPVHNLDKARTQPDDAESDDGIHDSDHEEHENPLDSVGQETSPIVPPSKPAKRRKKRKSVVLVKPRKRLSGSGVAVSTDSSGTLTNTNRVPGRERLSQTSEKPQSLPADNLESETESVDERPRQGGRKRARRDVEDAITTSPYVRREAEDASEDEYNPEDHTPEPPTPATVKRANRGKQTIRPGSDTSKPSKPETRRKKESFPITTYRMTNTHLLPTIREEEPVGEHQASDDEDTQGVFIATSDHPHPNTIDILSQICTEVIDTSISRLTSTSNLNPISTASLKHQRSALLAFQAHLQSRLLTLSNAVNDRQNLEARVRKAKHEKADLQAQWIELRKQREKVALKCDRIRKWHWDEEKIRENRWEISEAAHKVDVEMGRGEAGDEEDVEFLLRSVGEKVSSGSGGNLLDRVKDFNSVLERMAGVLEGSQ